MINFMFQCKICGNDKNNKTYTAKERIFGLDGEFQYLECSECNCIQLLNIPPDMSLYYPKEQYYSLSSGEKYANKKSLANSIRRIQSDYLLFGKKRLLGSLLTAGYGSHGYFSWLKKIGATYEMSILDVGCGGGELLFRMSRNGFKNLTGADPFNEADIHSGVVHIYKKEIFALDTTYDFIMLNHSFEHMEHPLEVLKKLYTLLKPGSFLLIRIPASNAYCWEKYGTCWAPLDAPRHLHIQSEKSMKLLSEQAGFELRDIIHDGTAFQFWGSEQYLKGINLRAENSYDVDRHKSIFSRKQIRDFKTRIRELNKQHLGGQAQFYLYKH